MRLACFILASVAALALAAPNARSEPRERVLHAFTRANGSQDGGPPLGALIADAQGNLYGTTARSGKFKAGQVFRLTPPAAGSTAWTETVLYTFSGRDGYVPVAGLTLDPSGALYGTTQGGGAASRGTVFRLTPPKAGASEWTETVLYSFTGREDGQQPTSQLWLDASGNLYGTTDRGGAYRYWGTIFRLSPPASGGTEWTEALLYSFNAESTAGMVGMTSPGTVIMDASGDLITTTQGGGGHGGGAVFQLSPPAAGQTAWTGKVLYEFAASPDDGMYPLSSRLVVDPAGALYGVTIGGGIMNRGTVFRVAPTDGDGAWTETVLHRFAYGTEGAGPAGGLVGDGKGVLYGTTSYGGANDHGAVFALTPDSDDNWDCRTLHAFGSPGDGAGPTSTLLRGPAGALAGTTRYGVNYKGTVTTQGTVFGLMP